MNAVESHNAYAGQKAFAPSPADGKFWTIWNWVVIPLMVTITIVLGLVRLVRWPWVLLSYWLMITGATLGFHRYFSHASFKTSRPVQFLLGLLGCYSGQTGPISWELTHRDHHRLCEVEGDPHTIRQGFWHAHGFFLWNYPARWTDFRRSKWAKYPEIVWLERWAPALYYFFGGLIFLATGFVGMVWYWLVPTFVSWNVTMLVNSWAHTWGRYDYRDVHQPDDCKARNLAWATPLLMGDNWHNNHHAYPTSAWQGWEWWQLDPNGIIIHALAKVGIFWDPIRPSAKVLAKAKVHPGPVPSVAE